MRKENGTFGTTLSLVDSRSLGSGVVSVTYARSPRAEV
jgi:hypothetical protein